MAIFTGRRLYTNNVQGTTTDNPLTDSATTLNSAGLANLAAVSSNHAVIVLDPLRDDGAPEIVIVTAHTGSATSATISRGAYGTTPRQHAAGTLWVHPVTKDDLIQVLTATPTDVYAGQLWYRSDTKTYAFSNGTDVSPLQGGGTLGYAQITSNITGISTETDLTGLSVTVTVGTGRRIRVSAFAPHARTVADGVTRLRIKESTTTLTMADGHVRAAGEGQIPLQAAVILTPSAGSHTYKLSLARDSGTGTVGCTALSTNPAFILVEDIGV